MTVRILHYSDIENAHDDPERIGRLVGLIDELRDDRTLVAGTGDNTSPGVLPMVTRGRQSIPFFRAADPDVETFGNHDFDYGPDRTVGIVEDTPQTWVTANIHRNGNLFGADAGTVPWTIEEVEGLRVGFFGVTDPKTPSINPSAEDLSIHDPIPAAREAVAELREEGVDRVVALSHLGQGDHELAAETDVDVILGGHLHTETVERVGDTLLTRPGVNGQCLFAVDVESRTATRHDVGSAPLDEEVVKRFRAFERETGLDRAVGTVEDPIERTETTAFRGESRIGNFVADAYRWATGADVGLQNSGGIRSGPPLSGTVTVADLVSVVPFKEPVAVAEVSGDDLLAAFRQANGANLAFGDPDWWHAHVSGARLTLDRGGELREATVGGRPVAPDRTYTVATSEYVYYTDHEFPALDESAVVETGALQYEVLADYACEEGIDPAVEGRIRRTGDHLGGTGAGAGAGTGQ